MDEGSPTKLEDLLTELSRLYHGLEWRQLRFLLFDLLPIEILSNDDNDALVFFNELRRQGFISCSNVIVLSEVAKLTEIEPAISCIAKYNKVNSCKKGRVLSKYRKTLFRAVREVASDELPDLIDHYKLDSYRDTFRDVWDLVYYLEKEKLLDNTPAKIETFAGLLNATARNVLQGRRLHLTSKGGPHFISAGGGRLYWKDRLRSKGRLHSKGRLRSEAPLIPNKPVGEYDQEFETVKAFNEALEVGKAEINQGRLIVMGLERVGKTSTIKSFLGEEFNPKEPCTDGIAENKIYIQNSPDVWKEAPKDMCPFIFTYNKKAKILYDKKAREQNVLTQEQPSSSSSSASKEEIPKIISSEALTFAKDEAASDFNIPEIPENAFIMNIWDFGGQPIYSVIQRMLFASFAVVCVVFSFEHHLNHRAWVRDPTTGKFYYHRMTYLDFIISCVRSVYMNGNTFELGGILFPPILLLGTHCNSFKVGATEGRRKSKIKKMSNEIWRALRNKPYGKMVLEIFPIENSKSFDKSGASDVMTKISTLTKRMVKPQPLQWMLVLKGIQKLRKEHFYQETNEIIKLIEQCGIKKADQQHAVLQYLHNIGEIFYYPKDDALKDIIVIDIMKVVTLSTAIITIIEPKLQAPKFRDSWDRLNTGILKKRLLIYLWEKFGVKGNLVDFFASLLQRFGLICKKEVKEGQECVYYVLSRLKPVPDIALPYDENRAISLFHDFSHYLPDHIFQRGATKFIEKFQMMDDSPKLGYEQVRLNIDEKHYVILNVDTYKHRRMFKTTIVRLGVTNGSEDVDPEPSVCKEVLSFLQKELKLLCPSDEQDVNDVKLKTYIQCRNCKEFHSVSNFNSDWLVCGMRRTDIKRYHWLFGDDHTGDGQGDGVGRGEEAALLEQANTHGEASPPKKTGELLEDNRNIFSRLYNFVRENQRCKNCLISAFLLIFFTLIGLTVLAMYYSIMNSDNWPYFIVSLTATLSNLFAFIFNKTIRTEIKQCLNISNSEREAQPSILLLERNAHSNRYQIEVPNRPA